MTTICMANFKLIMQYISKKLQDFRTKNNLAVICRYPTSATIWTDVTVKSSFLHMEHKL